MKNGNGGINYLNFGKTSFKELFYQQLLLWIPIWNEEQLTDEYTNYRSRFQAEFPRIYQSITTTIQHTSEMLVLQYSQNYQNLIDNLTVSLHDNLWKSEFRISNLIQSTINLINSKIGTSQNNPLTKTHIVRYHETINIYIGNFLSSQRNSIGVILEVFDDEYVIVVFPLAQGISCKKVVKETVYFNIYGSHPQKKQFPLQNASVLTVHKTQGLT
ncbi:hypothetical protein Glove_109g224 [Diversispora epigaea]|uniref:Uncharacterized protein n=1 Tax=Diversispora epigaea TaxID=1348612 RepID=A0A397J4K6_9GLOM|nr:hypothetical protein Glove_109g224 [Diversispora epigaea]